MGGDAHLVGKRSVAAAFWSWRTCVEVVEFGRRGFLGE